MTMLSFEILDDLVTALRRQGAPVVDHLRPGLSDAQIDDTLAPLELTFPEEIRRWYRYRDGVNRTQPIGHQALARQYWWAPLEECCEEYQKVRDVARDIEVLDLPSPWPAYCFPFVVGGMTMAVDISTATEAPVYALDMHDTAEDHPTPRYSTLGELVQALTLALNAGGLTWVAAQESFVGNEERLEEIGVPTEVV